MADIQRSFQRYEKKFLLTPKQFHALLPRLHGRMQTDAYGFHTVCNIYYDTDSYEMIRTSLEAPVYKEKFRVRSYGVPTNQDDIYAEIKKSTTALFISAGSRRTRKNFWSFSMENEIFPTAGRSNRRSAGFSRAGILSLAYLSATTGFLCRKMTRGCESRLIGTCVSRKWIWICALGIKERAFCRQNALSWKLKQRMPCLFGFPIF